LENVVIQAGDCTVTLLPELGGKIASILVGQRELLQTPLNPYAPRTREMAFSESDASGWDECLPSVGECVVQTVEEPVLIPDHGDLWRVPWQTLSATSDSATMAGKCFSLPLELTRTVLLTEIPPDHPSSAAGSGWLLRLLYTLTNRGDYTVPWSWSAHPLFAIEPGDRIVLPDSVSTLHLEGSGGNRLGTHGDSVPWPIAPDAPVNGSSNSLRRNLGIAQSIESAIGDKLSAGPLRSSETNKGQAAENWCTLERPGAGLRVTVRFDPSLTPYLGLWLCYGGWPDGSGKKQVCVATEPATAPVDSLAETGPWSRILPAGETYSWPMEVQIEQIANVDHA
jgi:hypothetical protein